MQSLLLKLQADVEARKHPRLEGFTNARNTVLACMLLVLAFYLGSRAGANAAWIDSTTWSSAASPLSGAGEADLQQARIDRLERIHAYSAKYGIPADLAASIEEIALAEGIKPDLAFELVRTESEFNRKAVSPVGAIGYTQLMPATARLLKPGIQREQIFDRETNLRLGFRFLNSLIRKYEGNVRLALLAYNRGPERVDQLLRSGVDPNNGYVQMVLGR